VLDTPASAISVDPSLNTIATVQIKWIDGTVLIAKMFAEDKIGDIRTAIKAHLDDGKCPEFELRSAYPPRALSDETTLVEAQLVPNGTLHARST
jgi:hypothetical protein